MVSVSIIIVNYKTKDLVIDCIRSVLSNCSVSFDLFVVDNNSLDGLDQVIENLPFRVNLFTLSENIGFAKANNYAAKHTKSEYILLLNPDTAVLNHAIDKLFEFAQKNPYAGIWGGRTIFPDGKLNPSSCWRQMTVWGLICRAFGLAKYFSNNHWLNPEAYGGWQRNTVKEVDIVSGCFLLVKRDLWNELGGFDERFFMYGEDADLCLRAKKLGYRPMITPDAEIIHYGGASESSRSDKLVKLLRAKMMLIERHWSNWKKPIGYFLLSLWPFNKYLIALFFVTFKKSLHREWIEVWKQRKLWLPPFFYD